MHIQSDRQTDRQTRAHTHTHIHTNTLTSVSALANNLCRCLLTIVISVEKLSKHWKMLVKVTENLMKLLNSLRCAYNYIGKVATCLAGYG